jgi:diguanylate cyclase (GGDEF)-like protein
MAERFLRSGIGRLVLLLVLLAATPGMLLMTWLALAARAENLRAAGERQQQTAMAAVRLFEELLDSARLAMRAGAADAPRWATAPEACVAGAAGIAASHPVIQRVVLVGGDGRVLCTSAGLTPGLSLADRPHVQRALTAGDVVFGAPVVSRIAANEVVLPIALAVPREPGLPADAPAVLTAALDLDWMVRQVATGRIGSDRPAFATIVSDNGLVVATHPAQPGWSHEAARLLSDAVLSAPLGWERLPDPEGRDSIVGFAHMLSTGLAIAVGVDRTGVLRPLDRHVTITLALAVLSVAFGIAVAMAVARRVIGRPVLALADAARAVAAGTPPPPLPIRAWHGEFEALKQAFRHMTTEIARRQEALEVSNSELEAANRLLIDLAERDSLTGLANRRAFDLALEAAWKRGQREAAPVGLLIIDLDHFKQFNDRYGHLEGDACLMRVARLLLAMQHRPYDLAARLGGEEFVLLLPDTDLPGAVAVGERIRAALHDMMLLHEGSPHGFVTASIGAASMVPLGPAEPRVLLAAADRALYAAKAAGRDRVSAGGWAAAA